MPVNWVRLSWTLAVVVLALMVFFIYTEYVSTFQRKYGNIEIHGESGTAVVKKKEPTRRRVPRRSRRYRLRR